MKQLTALKKVAALFAILFLSQQTQAGPLYKALPYCKDNSTCLSYPNAPTNPEDVCCGFIEYERNGVPFQDVLKCLSTNKLQDYLDEYNNDPRFTEVGVGCYDYTEDDGFYLNDYALFNEEV